MDTEQFLKERGYFLDKSLNAYRNNIKIEKESFVILVSLNNTAMAMYDVEGHSVDCDKFKDILDHENAVGIVKAVNDKKQRHIDEPV
ncbi:hypothetical protein [Sulfuricurvum sp.]|uniref:hypothetical protein n=1 Tax=Sulfuricurvum sp. TaxID=2025608 RepID=UPI00356B168A